MKSVDPAVASPSLTPNIQANNQQTQINVDSV